MPYQDTKPDAPAHLTGVRKGEERAKLRSQRLTRKADDASGINVADRRPIDPRMPNLPPA